MMQGDDGKFADSEQLLITRKYAKNVQKSEEQSKIDYI